MKRLLSVKYSALIFVTALATGAFLDILDPGPGEGIHIGIAIGSVLGFNLGHYLKNRFWEDNSYDERDMQNLDEGLAWGFIVLGSLTGIDIATGLSWTKAYMLIISTAAAILVMIYRNYRQIGSYREKVRSIMKGIYRERDERR